jgi:hypothetical protein
MQPLATDRSTGDGQDLRPGAHGDRGRSPWRWWSPWLALLLIALLAAAVYFARISAPGAIAAAVFGSAALFFAERLVGALERGERVSFESAWGGLGGGLGGWRLTSPLVYLVASAIFGALLLAVAVQEMARLAPLPAAEEPTAEAAGEADNEAAEEGTETAADRSEPAAEEGTGARNAEDPGAAEAAPDEGAASDDETPPAGDAAAAPAQPTDRP